MTELQTRFTAQPSLRDLAVAVIVAMLFWHVAGGFFGLGVGLAILAVAHVCATAAARWRKGAAGTTFQRGCRYGALVALAVAAPFVSQGGFRTAELTLMLSFAIVLVGLNLLTGYTGQISVGHSAFAGLGAYATAILLNSWHLNIYVCLVLAALASALAGFAAGWPALRLSGIYLAIVTVALAVMFPLIVSLNDLQRFTGGYSGLVLGETKLPHPDVGWLTQDRWNYFVAVALLAIAYLATTLMLRRRRVLRLLAIRDSELLGAAMGVNVRRTKLAVFTVSAAIAGMGGFVSFVVAGMFVAPDSFTVLTSVNYLVALTVGGLAAAEGPILGALFFIFIYQSGLDKAAADTQAGSNWWLIGVGCVLALVVARRALRSSALRRFAAGRSAGGRRAVSAIAAGGAGVACGVIFVIGFRLMTTHFLTLQYLNAAIAGVLLIVVVKTMPGGVAEGLQRLERLGGTKRTSGAVPPPAAARAPGNS